MLLGLDTGSTFIGVCIFLVGLIAATPYIRRGQSKATIELLRSELAVETDARIAQEKRCDEKIDELDRKHEREVGELRGQVKVVNERFAATLGRSVGQHVIDTMHREGYLKPKGSPT